MSVLNDVDEFCRSVGQANAEKQYELEKSKVDAEREEREAKVKKEKEIDLDVEEEYRKLKAQRMGVKFEVNYYDAKQHCIVIILVGQRRSRKGSRKRTFGQ